MNHKAAEEKLLYLHRQGLKVVKTAVCQVQACTRKRLKEALKHRKEMQKEEEEAFSSEAFLFYQILTATKKFSPL